MANSILLVGNHGVFLIDAQKTVNNTKKLIDQIRETHLPLTQVFFTHAHPDHILGAALLKKAFPNAKFVSTESVSADIRNNGETLRLLITKILSDAKANDQIASSVVIPEAIKKNEINFEGSRLKVIEVKAGESGTAAMIYLPEEGALIAGDVLYNKVHLWLRDGKVKEWIENLGVVKTLPGLKVIYPGHGESSDPTLVDADIQYLHDFNLSTENSKSAEEAITKMKKLYPDFKMDGFLTIAAKQFFSTKEKK